MTKEQIQKRISELRRDLIPAKARVESILSELYKLEYRLGNLKPKSVNLHRKPFGSPHGMPRELRDVLRPTSEDLGFDVDRFTQELESLEL